MLSLLITTDLSREVASVTRDERQDKPAARGANDGRATTRIYQIIKKAKQAGSLARDGEAGQTCS